MRLPRRTCGGELSSKIIEVVQATNKYQSYVDRLEGFKVSLQHCSNPVRLRFFGSEFDSVIQSISVITTTGFVIA